MSDQDSNREAGPSDLLTELEFILKSDPLIDHKLGISSDAIHALSIAAKHVFMAALDGYKRISSVSASKDGSGDEIMSSCSSSFLLHERKVMKHSRALFLLSSDFGTAWNSRKLIVHMKRHFPMFEDELFLSALVLSYAPKSERAWSHRLERFLCEGNDPGWGIGKITLLGGQVLDEWKKCREWAGLHVADSSCLHYRTLTIMLTNLQRLMLRMLEDSWYNNDSNACHNCNAGLYEMWKEELDWVERLTKRYRGREVLWLYRRFRSVCWMKHFSNRVVSCYSDHQSSSIYCLDIFMDNELQLLRSCTTMLSFEFEDYQADAKFSPVYILWLIKHMPESHQIEFQKKLQPEELETLLNNVCPEKIFLWDSLRTQCEGLEILGSCAVVWRILIITVSYVNRLSVRKGFCSHRILLGRCHSAGAECSDGILLRQDSARPLSLCSGRVFGRNSVRTEFCSAVVNSARPLDDFVLPAVISPSGETVLPSEAGDAAASHPLGEGPSGDALEP
ncbi:hypothetical protein RJ639_023432 [Escallonia herrerae]|uniref:Uncharacterized protein n=1 Tax=Escallonia herrerae TaxID=1293975 RepID=A0AA89AFB2_9ASTE|nr:hypothetical protein RJ639_023432 [Escallonia herrerae]